PAGHGTFLWQIGRSDRTGGEYALATHPVEREHPRDYDKPSRIPGDLTFTVGESWEPADWYYAQTNPGTWTVRFTLDRVPAGTAVLTVSSSMQGGSTPTVAVNGATDGITGSLPDDDGHDGNGLGGTIGRQADRSGRRRLGTLSFPASMLKEGANTLTLSRGATIPAGDGMGWDTLLLEVDPGTATTPGAVPAAKLKADVVGLSGTREAATWTVRVSNGGRGTAHDLRLTGARRQTRWGGGEPLAVTGRDPALFPVPVAASLAPGAATTFRVTAALPEGTTVDPRAVVLAVSADGGRTRTTTSARTATWPWTTKN
ncbi:polysaccharide lyase family protein, partial [Streptomyces sulfonofaciens]|uniref:polysaccharide lyase family protein n=1 Tax=Streptomyces sulfonofaciens TaxID=68272 RepID=UPI00227D7F4F